ncbi:MAG: hypothetical protein WDN50_08835 [Bradyrhizobium sp.]
MIDSVRVAATLPGAGGGKQFVVWGHSQGGHAALFTGIIAKNLRAGAEPAWRRWPPLRLPI